MALTLKLIEGFETQGFERASATGGSSSPTIDTTNVRAGVEGLACLSAVDGNTGYADYLPYEYEGSANSNAKGIGFWCRYGGTVGGSITLLQVFAGGTGGTKKFDLRLGAASNGRLYVYDSTDTLISSTSASQIFTDTSWHLVEFWFQDGSNSASWELFVDGTSYQSGTAAAFVASNSDAFRIGQINSVGTPAAKVDDIYYGEATATTDLVSQQGYDGLDIFACVGDGTSTTSGTAFSTGTDADVQEIPVNDTNYGGWSDPTLSSEFRYPTAVLTQTNLTGSVTDIDENPDSPDGLWMTASGKSTLHVQVQDPVYYPQIGTGLQKLRVLLRKNATGPTPSTDRIAPDTIATQTNLTGAVTDIDDDPDSPDANWLTASGSSTLRTTFSTPSSNPVTGANLQNFRVLLRKNATGPSGTSTEDVLPDGLGASDANLTGTAATIDDDPQSPGGDWRTASSDNSNSVCHAQFATPANTPATGAGLQTFEIYARLTVNGSACTYNVYLYENGSALNGGTAIATGSLTSTTGQLITATWNASLLGTADGSLVECVFEVVKSGGNPAARTTGEVDAVRWVSAYSATETQPGYEIKLYENGSEVVAAGSATGTLTDAGGDTVVQFQWDATNLGTADGSLVECYINQTSGADRYIEVGAVEWNCYNGPGEFTPAYELKLYENGSEVVAAGSTTGTLTDAGGDTIVELSWDASVLSDPTGDNIEVYINQTDVSPTRYIEVGAVQVHIQRYVSFTRYLKADGTGSFTGPSTGRTLDGAILGGSALVRHRYTGSGTHLDSVVGLGGTAYSWVSTGTLTAAWTNKHVLIPTNVVPTITQDSTIRWARRDVDYTDVGIDWAETIPQFAYAPTANLNRSATINQTFPSITQAVSVQADYTTAQVTQTLGSLTQTASGTHLKTYTATTTQTLPSLTQSATATHLKTYTATVTQTVSAITQIATGAFVPWSASGTISQLLPAVMQSGTGTHSPPVFAGTVTQTLPSITQALSGTFAITYYGSVSQTLSSITQAAAGTHLKTYTITAAQTLPALTQAASATFLKTYTATAAQTLGAITQAATVNFTPVGAKTATVTQTLPALTQAATATFAAGTSTGSVAQTLSAIGQSLSGTFLKTYSGTTAQTLPSLTQTATAAFTAVGTKVATVAQTLPSLSQSATATFAAGTSTATAAQTLQSITQAASGTHLKTYLASALNLLPGLNQSATATFSPVGGKTATVAQALSSVTQSATATFAAGTSTATAAQTLPAVTQALSGTHLKTYTATATQTLPAITQAVTALNPGFRVATAAQTLAALQQAVVADNNPPGIQVQVVQALQPVSQLVTATNREGQPEILDQIIWVVPETPSKIWVPKDKITLYR